MVVMLAIAVAVALQRRLLVAGSTIGPVVIRQAVPDDVAAMVVLAAGARAELAEYQPMFWRSREGAAELQDAWFRFLITSDADLVLVGTDDDNMVVGFLIAKVTDAAPVFDPGGRTCVIDDFVAPRGVVFDGLLAAARTWAAGEGAVQLVEIVRGDDLLPRAKSLAHVEPLATLVDDFERPVLHVCLNFRIGESSTDETFGVEDSIVRIHGDLILCGIADETLRICECDV
jgi:hypothetical protein